LKNIFIKDLTGGSDALSQFLVKQKDLNKAKNDKYYLALKLCDKTGEIEARVWDNAEYLASLFDKGDIISVLKGSASIYQKKVQITIQNLEKADRASVDMSDFIESSKYPLDEMFSELTGYFKSIKNSYIKKLLDLFFSDDEFTKSFKTASAAKALHHSYMGGLLEHTLSVTKLIMLFKKNYPELNEDLLIAGAVLHDIGKTKELSPDIGFEYTDSGRLLGHIVIGVTMLDKKIDEIKGFPQRLADHLKHMILSHHGIYEWGSPKRPKTKEALCLHYADDFDAKMAMFDMAVKRDLRDEAPGWTGYNSLFERYLFKDSDDYGDDEDVTGTFTKKEKKGDAKAKDPGEGQFSMFEDEP
jgi:3'-5' exoribonuclease